MLVLLATLVTACLTYSFVRRIFWLEQETKDCIKLYAKLTGQALVSEDLILSREYMEDSRRTVGILAAMSWLALIITLVNH